MKRPRSDIDQKGSRKGKRKNATYGNQPGLREQARAGQSKQNTGQSRRQPKEKWNGNQKAKCNVRESNPGLDRGRVVFYH